MVQQQKDITGGFHDLGPDRVLNLVEKELGIRCKNLFRPLNSYINRVFEIETEEGVRMVVKFYRPGRWSKKAILDEHTFLTQLAEQEISVIAPLRFRDGETLAEKENLLFSVFPKCGGRSSDEFNDDQWLQIGRLLGRVHQVGESAKAKNRITMGPRHSTLDQLNYLLASSCVAEDLKPLLRTTVMRIIEDIEPLFLQTKSIRIHGDCHFSNIIHRPGESFYLIDFDDMAMGPPVQDIWMLLPGAAEEAVVELDLLLEGYETFRAFDRRTLLLIEPLRAMRFIHYMAWCAHQVEADGITRAIDDFGTRDYWQREIDDLIDQEARIADAQMPSGNVF
ncbi:MAG: serine/threonine protein kinase [Proteobacteria bacterium]|nr:serine/threonine protein kinase [Pseudomonadota bacterium]